MSNIARMTNENETYLVDIRPIFVVIFLIHGYMYGSAADCVSAR